MKQESSQAAGNYSLPPYFVETIVLEVTYTLEPKDFVAYRKYVANRLPWFHKAIAPLAVIMSFVVLFLPIVLKTASRRAKHLPLHIDWTALAFSFLLPAAAIALAWPLLRWWSHREQWKNPLCRFPQTLAIAPDGLIWEHQQTRTTVFWPGVTEISFDDHVLHFIAEPQAVYLVPRRVFPTLDASNDFLRTALAYWKNEALSHDETIWPPIPRV